MAWVFLFVVYLMVFVALPAVLVNARTMSCATDGFSAMISDLVINVSFRRGRVAPRLSINTIRASRAHVYTRARP